VGAGAHSLLNNIRFSNEYSIENYIKCITYGKKPVTEQYTIDLQERMSEYMFLGFRLIKGINNSEFKNIFMQDMFDKYHSEFEELLNRKLIEVDENNVRLTGLGLDLANQVFVKFV
jgi:oxygen-independent coproporphyrinogen-3 oxidase